jgi:hypothetical protein
MQLSEVDTKTLVHDLLATIKDAAVCEMALSIGLAQYGTGKSVAYRLADNRQIEANIRAELARRGEIPEAAHVAA